MKQYVDMNEGVKSSTERAIIRLTFTGKDPREGWRTPQNKNKCSEQRDEETGFEYETAGETPAYQRPDGGQIPAHFTVCLLCLESVEAGGSRLE